MPLVTPYINQEREKIIRERALLEEKISEIEKELLNRERRIILITEGKTDTKLIKIAFEKINIDETFRDSICYYDFAKDSTLGDALNTLLNQMKNMSNPSIIVGLFDRDKPIHSSEKNDFIYLGNGVYKTNIPAIENGERGMDDKICIEHYFSNTEIKKSINGQGRLYMGNDFDKYGVSRDRKFCFQGWKRNKGINAISIIDAANKHIQEISDDAKIVTKDQFAEYVVNHPEEFNFKNFIRIYEHLRKIARHYNDIKNNTDNL